MSQPMYTVLATSNAYANAGSQAERGFNRGYGNDVFITSTGGETANISPSTFSAFTSTGDQTAIYVAGRRMRIVHGGASTDTTYCEVASAVLTGGSTATTVTIRNITAGATNLSTSAIGQVGVSPVWASSSGGNLPQQFPYLAFGASTAYSTNGLLQMTNNGGGLRGRNAANTANVPLIDVDGSDIVQIAPFGQQSNIGGDVVGAGFSAWGATPATAGTIRIPSGGTLYQRNAANNANDQLLPLQTQEGLLGADIVGVTATSSGTSVASVVLPPGTWFINALVHITTSTSTVNVVAFITDNTTVEASAQIRATDTTAFYPISLHGLITNATTSSSTYRVNVTSSSSGVNVRSVVTYPTTTVYGANASRITAIRTGQ